MNHSEVCLLLLLLWTSSVFSYRKYDVRMLYLCLPCISLNKHYCDKDLLYGSRQQAAANLTEILTISQISPQITTRVKFVTESCICDCNCIEPKFQLFSLKPSEHQARLSFSQQVARVLDGSKQLVSRPGARAANYHAEAQHHQQ